MTIFAKTVKDIDDVLSIFDNTCHIVCNRMKSAMENYAINRYDDWVCWALKTCIDNTPSPFSTEYPGGLYSLNVGPNFFNIRFPSSFAFGIRVNNRKDVSYEVTITFFNEPVFIENTPNYKSMIKNGWKVKDIKKK